MSFIHRQYDGQEESSTSATTCVIEGRTASSGSSIPVNGINRAVVRRVDLRADARDATSGPCTSPRTRTPARRCASAGSASSRACRSSSSSRRTGPLIGPVTAYLDVLDLAWPPERGRAITIVVLPEYVARHWWDRLLYNQSAKRLKAALVGREHTVIADVPTGAAH